MAEMYSRYFIGIRCDARGCGHRMWNVTPRAIMEIANGGDDR